MSKPAFISKTVKKIIDNRAAEEAARLVAAAKELQANNSLRASKEQLGKQAELSAARQAAEGAARDLTSSAPDTPTVAVGVAEGDGGAPGSVKKRRARFGIGTESSGVNI